ncbi:solute carrier family 13 member 5-like isoform X2 [Amblyraja radiata]|uniref:solute carrier family 13 member 5-like isoform X2 n=1 Tax=Amblyraja radiata TaxID=386614 RepID=UPI001403375D|nr:solute carrier family 13 member 5-like isoform X2 [Amblyraja radiata]
MLACLRSLREFRDPLALTLPVMMLLPLPLVLRCQEAYCGFIVLLMAVYWCTEVIPLAITAILPVLLFPMFGIMTSKEVCKQYMKDTNMLFLGGLMVAVAVETCNLHKRIALRALLFVGVRPALLMMGFMGVTAFLSMWISNTATTAMMVPIAQAVLDQLSTTAPQPGAPEPGHGQTARGQELEEKDATVEGIQPALISPVMQTQDANVEREMEVSAVPHSDEQREQQRLRKMLSLAVCYSASIGGTATLTGTGPNLVLKGQFSHFGRLRMDNSPREQAAYGIIQEEYRKLGLMSFAEKLVLGLFVLLITLWFTREPGFVSGWGSIFNWEGKKFVTDATVVMFITVLMFIMPSRRPRIKGWAWKRTVEAEPGIDSSERKDHRSGRLLEWKEVQRKLPWNVVLLLGGGFALAKGCEVSGLSLWLGSHLLPLQNLPPWVIAALLCLLIAIFTECTSNVATATLFLPILASMAVLIKLNPLYVMIPGTLSTSFAFMLPVATPPNAIVFSYGHLRVTDMVKAGFVLNLIGVVSVTVAINTWGRAMFHLDTFPAWANISSSL